MDMKFRASMEFHVYGPRKVQTQNTEAPSITGKFLSIFSGFQNIFPYFFFHKKYYGFSKNNCTILSVSAKIKASQRSQVIKTMMSGFHCVDYLPFFNCSCSDPASGF